MTANIATDEVTEPKTPRPFWQSKWLWLTVIPPYIDFSGYSYFKGKMTGFGFPDAEINASIGEAYLQAYEAFSVITGGLLNAAIKNFIIVFDALLIYSVVGAICLLLYILYRHYKPRWLIAWLVKMDQATAHERALSHR